MMYSLRVTKEELIAVSYKTYIIYTYTRTHITCYIVRILQSMCIVTVTLNKQVFEFIISALNYIPHLSLYSYIFICVSRYIS